MYNALCFHYHYKVLFWICFFFQFVIWNWNIVEKKWIITNPLKWHSDSTYFYHCNMAVYSSKSFFFISLTEFLQWLPIPDIFYMNKLLDLYKFQIEKIIFYYWRSLWCLLLSFYVKTFFPHKKVLMNFSLGYVSFLWKKTINDRVRTHYILGIFQKSFF